MSDNTFLWESLQEELRYQMIAQDLDVQRRVQTLMRRDLTDTQLRSIIFYTMALGVAHHTKHQKETTHGT
jgi:hypothetical protein